MKTRYLAAGAIVAILLVVGQAQACPDRLVVNPTQCGYDASQKGPVAPDPISNEREVIVRAKQS